MVYGGLILLTAPIIPMLQVYEVIIKYTLTITVVNILAGLCAVLSKSWSYLFTAYGYGDNESGNRSARSYPLSYVYSGFYFWDAGRFFLQTLNGYYWSSSIYNSNLSYRMSMYSINLIKANSNDKRLGLALRCVIKTAQRSDAPWALLSDDATFGRDGPISK